MKRIDEVLLRTLKHLEQVFKSCSADQQPTEHTVNALREIAQYFLSRDKAEKTASVDKQKADRLTSLVTKDKIAEWVGFPSSQRRK